VGRKYYHDIQIVAFLAERFMVSVLFPSYLPDVPAAHESGRNAVVPNESISLGSFSKEIDPSS
jgi:hypothetical protein